jgi:hypothetical protein
LTLPFCIFKILEKKANGKPALSGWKSVCKVQERKRKQNIGAHAAATGMTLITRDIQRVRYYFPTVELVSP